MEKAVSLPSSLQIKLVKQTKWFLIFLYNSLKTQLKLTVFMSTDQIISQLYTLVTNQNRHQEN